MSDITGYLYFEGDDSAINILHSLLHYQHYTTNHVLATNISEKKIRK